MILVESNNTPSLRLFINDELFIDQTLSSNIVEIKPRVNADIVKITVENTGSTPFTANKTVVEPASTENLKINNTNG